MSRAGIAFLDVDRTVVRGSSGRYFLSMGVKEGLFPPSSIWHIPNIYLRFWLGRLESRKRPWELPVLRNKSREHLEALAERSFAQLKREIYPQAAALIACLREEGKRVVFATSSLGLIVWPLARHLGVDDVVATSLEFEGSVCTGRLAGPLLWKEEKKRGVLEYLRGQRLAAEACSFYTDSVQDLPLLEAVGEPVAVNPDRHLRWIARRRGWRILRFVR